MSKDIPRQVSNTVYLQSEPAASFLCITSELATAYHRFWGQTKGHSSREEDQQLTKETKQKTELDNSESANQETKQRVSLTNRCASTPRFQ